MGNKTIVIEPDTTFYAFKWRCEDHKQVNSNIRTCSGDICMRKKGRDGGEAALGSCKSSACPALNDLKRYSAKPQPSQHTESE